ncbi:MAG TPA: TonB-dependent receptor [Pedobacter sp.]|uniref:SusC/RagA family TonB-linked outer membrane protein n=1 Tax=Pedobacter sp. TaxID=1411316 RepID=UPI002BA00EB2|nr:TonB-dependent receptor [Pedobacter sp.]HMI02517.1 TonB-dependent receptor [Pedobacter sp.]
MKKLLQSLFILLVVAGSAMAQQRTITGIVTDQKDGNPLPGVTVRIPGSQGGTITSASGKFVLQVSSNATSLEFSYLGYVNQTLAIGNSNVVNAVLLEDSKILNEVVVVAYGTSTKAALTGSVASLSAEDLENRVITNISNVLAGVAPGIQANAGNGQPGTGSNIRIRGFGSISASNAPLYVVDGAVYDGSLADINSNDIETVSLLKDASSSALYGARGANGVIIITTKKGKLGEAKLSINLNQGISERGIPEYDRVGTLDYYPAMWQALRNSLVYPRTGTPLSPAAAATQASNTIQTQLVYNPFNVPNNQIVGADGKLNPNASLLYDDFDWIEPLARTGKRSDFNMSLGGNTGKSDYYVSLGYLNDKGYIEKSDFNKFNGRVNVNSQIKPWLKTGLNVSGTLSKGNLASDASTGNATSFVNAFSFARGIGPIYPVRAYDATGNPIFNETGEQWWDYGAHPGAVARPGGASQGRHVVYETRLNDNLFNRTALNARTFAEIKFLKDFTFKTNVSLDVSDRLESTFWNRTVGDGVSSDGYGYKESTKTQSFTFNQLLSYDKTIGEHAFNVLAAHENYDLDVRSLSADKTGQILEGNTEFPNFVTPTGAGGFRDTYRIESVFGRATYNYASKYFVEGSLRRDGSSKFSADSRWGTFYSAGASWIISKENFMSGTTWVNNLKLKASYGSVANDGLEGYYRYQAFYDLGWNNGTEPGILLSTVATPDLKWESQNTLNLGLSFSLFDNRIYGEFEAFKKGSSNLLFDVPQPLSDPVTTIAQNIGSMYNKGLELQLGAEPIRTKDFSWNILTNWSIIRNKITKMPEKNPVITVGTKRREVGKDLYNFWLRQWAGVDPADGSSLYIPNDGVTTDLRTVNGQTYTTNFNNAKFAYSGSALPKLFGSVTNTLDYKAFSFSFLINYQIGGKFYDSNYAGLMSVAYGSALHKDVLKSWTPENPNSNIPRLDIGSTTFINAASSRWLIDASYVSFRNASLSYKLPKSLLGKIDVSGARIFVLGENLGIISKRKGMNPTESFDGTNSSTYLPSRMISIGLNVSL